MKKKQKSYQNIFKKIIKNVTFKFQYCYGLHNS